MGDQPPFLEHPQKTAGMRWHRGPPAEIGASVDFEGGPAARAYSVAIVVRRARTQTDEIASFGSAQSWTSALGAAQDFEFIAVATHLDTISLSRTNLLSEFPLKVQILGLGTNTGQTHTTYNELKIIFTS